MPLGPSWMPPSPSPIQRRPPILQMDSVPQIPPSPMMQDPMVSNPMMPPSPMQSNPMIQAPPMINPLAPTGVPPLGMLGQILRQARSSNEGSIPPNIPSGVTTGMLNVDNTPNVSQRSHPGWSANKGGGSKANINPSWSASDGSNRVHSNPSWSAKGGASHGESHPSWSANSGNSKGSSIPSWSAKSGKSSGVSHPSWSANKGTR